MHLWSPTLEKSKGFIPAPRVLAHEVGCYDSAAAVFPRISVDVTHSPGTPLFGNEADDAFQPFNCGSRRNRFPTVCVNAECVLLITQIKNCKSASRRVIHHPSNVQSFFDPIIRVGETDQPPRQCQPRKKTEGKHGDAKPQPKMVSTHLLSPSLARQYL